MNPVESLRHPPRVRAVFRVGLIGHRPDRLKMADMGVLRDLLHQVLKVLQSRVESFCAENPGLYLSEPPILRAVSALAEGTDRLFAEQAIDLGYELVCPMPFAQEEFEKDFVGSKALEADSLDRFRSLLARAEASTGLTKFELDGSRAAAGDAYAAAGRVVLNQSDVLVVVWDGQPAAGAGGTVQTMREALACGVPVFWIDAQAPHGWQIIATAKDISCLPQAGRCLPTRSAKGLNEVLHDTVANSLQPTAPHGQSNTRPATAESRPAGNLVP